MRSSCKFPLLRRKALWTNLGRTDSSVLAGTGLGETTLMKNTSSSKAEGKSPHGKDQIFDHLAVQVTLDRCMVVFMDRSQVRTAPGPHPQRSPSHATDCSSGSPVARGGQTGATDGFELRLAHWNVERVRQKKIELQNFLKTKRRWC